MKQWIVRVVLVVLLMAGVLVVAPCLTFAGEEPASSYATQDEDEDEDEDEDDEDWEDDEDDEDEYDEDEDEDEGEDEGEDEDGGKADEPGGAELTAPIATPASSAGKSVTLSPRFSFLGGNALNEEITLGFTVDLWPSEVAGIEFNLSAFPLAGADNSKTLATAVLGLLPPQSRLESNDRVMSFTASLITAPFAGTLAPPGAPPVFIEFLAGVGGGLEVADVEMLACPGCNQGIAEVEVVNTESPSGQRYVRPVANLLIGSRLFPKPGFGLRVDLRLMGGPVTVLNFDDALARETNNSILGSQDPLLNRRSCLTSSDAVCRVALESSLTIEFGIDISLGAPRRRGPR